MNITEKVCTRVKMLGGRTDNTEQIDYCVAKAVQETGQSEAGDKEFSVKK